MALREIDKTWSLFICTWPGDGGSEGGRSPSPCTAAKKKTKRYCRGNLNSVKHKFIKRNLQNDYEITLNERNIRTNHTSESSKGNGSWLEHIVSLLTMRYVVHVHRNGDSCIKWMPKAGMYYIWLLWAKILPHTFAWIIKTYWLCPHFAGTLHMLHIILCSQQTFENETSAMAGGF